MEREWETSMDESWETSHAKGLTQGKGEREVDVRSTTKRKRQDPAIASI